MLTIEDFRKLDNPNKTTCIAIGLDMFNNQVAWQHQCNISHCNNINHSWIQGDEGIAVLWVTRKETETFEQKAILRLQIGQALHEVGIRNIDALLDKYESLTMANGL